MPKITINPEELEDFKTNLYEYKGNVPVRRILAHTSADQVQFANKKNAETVVTELDTLIATAQSTANSANLKAETAQTTATSAQNTASAAQTAASNAASVANSANTKAEAAQTAASSATSIANTAKTSAEGATATANAAQSLAESVQTTANTANTTANAVKAAVENATTGLAATKEIADAASTAAATAQSSATSAAATAAAAQTSASNAVSTANEAKTLAENALPKTGGTVDGSLSIKSPSISLNGHNAVGFSDYNHMDTRFSNTIAVGVVRNVWTPETTFTRQLIEAKAFKEDGTQVISSVEAVAYKNGVQAAWAPQPQSDDYTKQIVTMRKLKDYAVKKTPLFSEIHVGGANASDTANLFQGRGLSADMPFATLSAAFAWVNQSMNAQSSPIKFILHSDQSLSGNHALNPAILENQVVSDDTKRTVTINTFTVLSGTVTFGNVNLQGASGAAYGLCSNGSYGSSMTKIAGGVSINGAFSASVVYANVRGCINVVETPTGNATGKKYVATNGSLIIGASKLPGSEAGTCDSTSHVS